MSSNGFGYQPGGSNKNPLSLGSAAGLLIFLGIIISSVLPFLAVIAIFVGVLLIVINKVQKQSGGQANGKNAAKPNKSTYKPPARSRSPRVNTVNTWSNPNEKCSEHHDDPSTYVYNSKTTTTVSGGICAECGKKASKDSTNCPHCGRLIK